MPTPDVEYKIQDLYRPHLWKSPPTHLPESTLAVLYPRFHPWLNPGITDEEIRKYESVILKQYFGSSSSKQRRIKFVTTLRMQVIMLHYLLHIYCPPEREEPIIVNYDSNGEILNMQIKPIFNEIVQDWSNYMSSTSKLLPKPAENRRGNPHEDAYVYVVYDPRLPYPNAVWLGRSRDPGKSLRRVLGNGPGSAALKDFVLGYKAECREKGRILDVWETETAVAAFQDYVNGIADDALPDLPAIDVDYLPWEIIYNTAYSYETNATPAFEIDPGVTNYFKYIKDLYRDRGHPLLNGDAGRPRKGDD